MSSVTFVLGGCRSGKSRHAQQLAESTALERRIFIATCVPLDSEMEARVQKHQADRDNRWTTVEAPIDLPDAVSRSQKGADVLLVDCLTLWASNILLDPETNQYVDARIGQLIESLQNVTCPTYVVSNETGLGIVPDNPLARKYRDITGFLNQRVAAVADTVIWMIAGIPVTIKGG